MSLPFETHAQLKSVSTSLRLRGECSGGRILDVTETLTYTLKDGWTTKAERVLQNQAEPDTFQVEWASKPASAGATTVQIESVVRQDPKKWSMNYESGHLTTLQFKFNEHHLKSSGETFIMHLNYVARLYGKEGKDGKEGVLVSQSSATRKDDIEGYWRVAGDEEEGVETTVDAKGCETGCNGWTVPFGALSKSDDGWKLAFKAPTSVGVGSDTCPVAWSIGNRNIWWVLTAICLFMAGMMCVAMLQTSIVDKHCFVGIFIFLSAAIVFFCFALLTDFHSTKDT